MADTWEQHGLPSDSGETPPEFTLSSAPRQSGMARSIPSGTGLNKYRILERVRNTHNAIVYRARDAMLDRLVTIKQMNPGLIDDPIACGDFKREAQLIARVPKDARNIINIHELISDEQGLFIVEEYAHGEWLERMVSKRQVTLTDSIRILKFAGLGLRALHTEKIVHRDIQPANLLMANNGQVRITNLGCAAHEGDPGPPPSITSKYAAPELQAGLEYDDRVDIYALGFVVYEVCVGRRALHDFFADVVTDLRTADEKWRAWHLDLGKALPQATELNPAVPPSLSQLLGRMTAKSLDQRSASAQEVLEALIKEFTQRRQQPAVPSIEGGPRILEIRQTHTQQFAHGPVPTQRRPISLAWLLNKDQSTSTHTITLSNRIEAKPHTPFKPAPVNTQVRRLPGGPVPPQLSREIRRPVHRAMPPVPKLLGQPKNIPQIKEATEPVERRPHAFLITAVIAATILLAVSAITVPIAVYYNNVTNSPQRQELQQLYKDGLDAFRNEKMLTARERFMDLTLKAQGDPDLQTEHRQAELMLLVLDGLKALDRNDFQSAESHLEQAKLRGANTMALDTLKTKFWNKRDAYQIASEGHRQIQDGQYDEVQDRLAEFAAKAPDAGLDPDSLKNKLEQSKKDKQFAKAMTQARAALKRKDFEGALVACRDAQAIRQTSETLQLVQDILDSKKREEWIIRGQKARMEGDFAEAEEAFKSANAIQPSEEVEQKIRVATAFRLLGEAKEAIKKGELLRAKRKLEASMWKAPNKPARNILTGMARAFAAAKLAQNADRHLAAGETAEAIRLYEKALPDLPPPASDQVRAKLTTAKQAVGS